MSSVLMSFPRAMMTLATMNSCLAALVVPGIGDDAGNGRRGGDGRTAQVDLGLGVPHASLEVPVRRAEGGLVVAQRPLVHAEAGAASGVHHHRAGGHEVLYVALGERLRENPARRGEDEHPRAG